MKSKRIGRAYIMAALLLVLLASMSGSAFAAPADADPPPAAAAELDVGALAPDTDAGVAAAGEGTGGTLDLTRYNKNMDIWFMLMLVAFLMMFIRKFEWSVCLATLLVAASCFITYLVIYQYFHGYSMAEVFSQDVMIGGVACAITAVIAIGMFLGTIKMWQYLLVGILFAPFYAFMEWMLLSWIGGGAPFGPGYIDPGCGILVHLVAAYWGWGVILALREKRAFNEPMHTTKHSVAFVWLAAMVLFILWPSFVSALAGTGDITKFMANCYMSGMGAIITVYLTSVICKRKVNSLVYCYAFLGGPVASSSTLMHVTPWVSMLIGALAGVLCTLAFTYLHGWLCKKLGALDIMGVHNLHGIGGWISLITGAIAIGSFVNIIAGVMAFAVALVGGLVTGFILKATRGTMPEKMFHDDNDFEGENPHPNLEPQRFES